MKFRKSLAAAAVGTAVAVFVPAAPADAATYWGGSGWDDVCLVNEYSGCVYVSVEGRVGSQYRYNDSTAGWGRIEAATWEDQQQIARVQIDKVVLGTQYGVLTTSGPANSGKTQPPFAQIQGPGHLWGKLCSTRYHVAVYWSARLTNGQVKTGKLLGPWYDSYNCY